MERIRLGNGTEYELIPMGIENRDKFRSFKIKSELQYNDILASFNNPTNLIKVEYVLADGSTGATYVDCVQFKSITFVPEVEINDNTVSDIYVVVISTDPIERALQDTNSNISTTMAAVDMVLTEFLPLIMG